MGNSTHESINYPSSTDVGCVTRMTPTSRMIGLGVVTGIMVISCFKEYSLFCAEDEKRLMPCKDDKPKDNEFAPS